jgi:IS66 Orf2 like protein
MNANISHISHAHGRPRYCLALNAIDMRQGFDALATLVIASLGEDAFAGDTAYLFINKSGTRIKVLMGDANGIWVCARRLHQGRFRWAKAWATNSNGGGGGALDGDDGDGDGATTTTTWRAPNKITLSADCFDALVAGIDWTRLVSAKSTQAALQPAWRDTQKIV